MSLEKCKVKRPNQDIPGLEVFPRTCVESINQKVKFAVKSLIRLKQVEITETDKMIANLEKIHNTENEFYSSLCVLLRKYANIDRWRLLDEKYCHILEAALRHKLKVIKIRHNVQIKEIEKKIDAIDVEIELEQGEGDDLIDYACTSYADMVAVIEGIKKHKKLLQFAYNWEKVEMTREFSEFIEWTERSFRDTEVSIKLNIYNAMSTMIGDKVLDLSQQNRTITKNLKELKEGNAKAEEIIRSIRKNLDAMLIDSENVTRKNFFPEFFSQRADCKPNTEFELDIPIKNYIPI